MDGADDDTIEAAKAFRSGSQPIAIAVLANVLLAATFLGWPYYRGHLHAQSSLRAFSGFAACLLGARAKQGLGLGMPVGEEEHFASQMMRGPSDWPTRCMAGLRAVRPPDAIFLWPSVKQAGADVRAVVHLMETELGTLTRRRKHEEPGRVPARPLLALAKLRAGLALFARAANADDELDGDAITFDKPALLADPARLPIVAGASAMLDVWAGQDGLSSVALDGRGISWLHVEGGKVEHRRFRRTSQLRAVLRAGDQPMIVWATSRARCEQDENKCLRRATGLARLDESAEQLPSPIWLGGHPAGRVDRSLQFLMDDRVDLLARADAFGALEVRRFKLERAAQAEAAPAREKSPAPADGATAAAASSQDDARPLAPLERFPVPAADTPLEALLLPGQPAAVVYATGTNSGIEVSLVRYENGAAKVMLGALGGSGAFIASCAVDDERFVVYGTQSELAIARIGADGEPNAVLPAASIALGDPLHPEDPGHDRLRLLCRSGRALLVATTRERSLFTLGCDRERCERGPELARDVSGFDASAFGETTLIAYARSAQPQLVVLRLDAHGAPLEAGQTPAACWDPHGGMCGQPKLASDGSRLLLCAREDSDLLALESEDGGRVWKTLSGLKVSTAINTDVNAAMEQHRKRKGLE